MLSVAIPASCGCKTDRHSCKSVLSTMAACSAVGSGVQSIKSGAGYLLGRAVSVVNPLSYLSAVMRVTVGLERYACRTWDVNQRRCEPGSVRAFLTGVTAFSAAAVAYVGRSVTNEILSCTDPFHFADHFAILGCPVIPEDYYTAGDCHRFSCLFYGDATVRPHADFTDILAIKGRCSVLQALYSRS